MRWLLPNWGLKVWALALAIALSAYVNNLNYSITETIEAPVRVSGLRGNLVIESEIPPTTKITIRGPLSIVGKLREGPPLCVLDLDGFSAPGGYEAEIALPAMRGVEVLKGPPLVKIALKERTAKSFSIEVIRVGQLPSDFIEKSLSISPESVTVTGSQDNVDMIAHAVIRVELAGERKDVAKIVDVHLTDANFKDLRRGLFSLDKQKVRYDLRISSLSNVRLLKLFPEVKGETPENFVFDIDVDPKFVPVPLEYMEGSTSSVVYTEPVDLTGVKESFKKKVRIDYKFKRREGLVAEAEVSVSIIPAGGDSSSSLTRNLEVVGREPGTSALIKPRYIVISSSDISLLSDDERAKVRAIVNLKGLAPGEYKIVPQVILDPKLKNPIILPNEITVEIVAGG